jgi:two-component system sensor histidine kinase KdpD
MSTKVNKLLDMARLQAGKVQLNRQWQPLEEVVGSALMATACTPRGTFAVTPPAR